MTGWSSPHQVLKTIEIPALTWMISSTSWGCFRSLGTSTTFSMIWTSGISWMISCQGLFRGGAFFHPFFHGEKRMKCIIDITGLRGTTTFFGGGMTKVAIGLFLWKQPMPFRFGPYFSTKRTFCPRKTLQYMPGFWAESRTAEILSTFGLANWKKCGTIKEAQISVREVWGPTDKFGHARCHVWNPFGVGPILDSPL